MTIPIDEAIEVLKKERNDHHSYPTDIIGQAEGLGVEALKRVKACRLEYGCPLIDPEGDNPVLLLPGEEREASHIL